MDKGLSMQRVLSCNKKEKKSVVKYTPASCRLQFLLILNLQVSSDRIGD